MGDTRAESVRVAQPLFQTAGGGSSPTSALVLWFAFTKDLGKCKGLNRLWHSRFPSVGGGGARACYTAEFEGLYYATAIWTNPTSPKLPQREFLMLKRWAISDDAPKNTASRMDGWMFRDLRRRFPEGMLAISYSDPDKHDGGIYRACGWAEVGTTERNTTGCKNWQNRERQRVAINDPCERVTRWCKPIKKVGVVIEYLRGIGQNDLADAIAKHERKKERLMADIKWTEFNPPERKRVYHFPGGDVAEFVNVTRIEIRDSGKHRIETADGRKAFVCPGWIWLEIDVDQWTC